MQVADEVGEGVVASGEVAEAEVVAEAVAGEGGVMKSPLPQINWITTWTLTS